MSKLYKIPDVLGRVFPCGEDKRPLTRHGFLDASADRRQIAAWWRQWPNALVGVPTGDRFVVVDCDLQHADAKMWFESHELPTARVHETRSGGKHVFFRPHEHFLCTTSKLGPHIDTRGGGGYIIWWPAEGYGVENSTEFPEVPQWMLRKLARPVEPVSIFPARQIVEYHPARVRGVLTTVINAPEGERNRLTYWGACRLAEMVAAGCMQRERAETLITDAATRSGLPVREVVTTLRSAFRAISR